MPITPYIISGTVYQLGTTTPSASNNLILTDETTGEQISTITNSQGKFIFDLANLTSGYTDEDFIKITATGTNSNGQNLRFKSVCYDLNAQIEEIKVVYEV